VGSRVRTPAMSESFDSSPVLAPQPDRHTASTSTSPFGAQSMKTPAKPAIFVATLVVLCLLAPTFVSAQGIVGQPVAPRYGASARIVL